MSNLRQTMRYLQMAPTHEWSASDRKLLLAVAEAALAFVESPEMEQIGYCEELVRLVLTGEVKGE